MDLDGVLERVRRVSAVRSDEGVVLGELEEALDDVRTVRAFCDAAEADIVRRIAACSSFPEATVAARSRGSLGSASSTLDRSRTLDAVPTLADALDGAKVTAGHVDAVTRGAKGLEPDQRQRFFDRIGELVDVAASATVEQFARRIRAEANRIVADDGMARLERQRRATSMSTWTDAEGMWNLRGRFDPVTALSVSAALDRAVDTLFTESVPESCPTDHLEKQKHLRALAFARLAEGRLGADRSRRAEFVAVIDLTDDSATIRAGSDSGDDHEHATTQPQVTWPIPVEVPMPVLAEMVRDADIHTVVVRNGVVLHAPGVLDLGRRTRLASRSQRRVLRGLYSSCAIPGCAVPFDRCRIHHIVWWRHGGRTDLDNLLPTCSHHHHQIHDAGWNVSIDRERRLTITFPDGTVRNTGPPRRSVA